MIDMFVWGQKEVDNAVQVQKGKLPLDICEFDIHCPLIRVHRTCQSGKHQCETYWAVMKHEDGCIAIICSHVDLPLSAFYPTCWKYCFVSKQIDTLVHLRYVLQISDRDLVQLTIIVAKGESFILFLDEYNGLG